MGFAAAAPGAAPGDIRDRSREERMTRLLSGLLCAACLLLLPQAALAQSFPSRQITLIVPFAPG